jgi:3-deoxy-D-manno-octulosonic-acid transferase
MQLFLYNFFYLLCMPFILLHLLYKAIKDATYLKDLQSRFGFFPSADASPLWIHVVSLGEVIGIEPLVRILEKDYSIVFTVSTATGYKKAKELYYNHKVSYAPWDFSLFVKIFLKRVSPKALIIFETEIWPNMIMHSKIAGNKILLVNGRLNERSFKRYKKVQGFFKDVFNAIDLYCVQTLSHQKRFEELGIDKEKIRCLGSIKFDMQSKADNTFRDLSRYILLASTHHNEEDQILKKLSKRANFETTRLVVCPRHPERADEISNLCSKIGLQSVLFSQVADNLTTIKEDTVLIVDEIGYLHSLYKNAEFCILGGSFITHGGHNIIEPALHNCPVISGPHFFNFESIFKDFIDSKACFIAENYDELIQQINCLNKEELHQAASRGNIIIQQHKGSSSRQAHALEEILKL